MLKQLLIIAIVLSFVACKSQTKSPMTPPTLSVYTVKSDSIPFIYEFVAQTESNYDYTIEPRVNGYLTSKNYSSGTPVKEGQLLFTIDSVPFEINVAKAKANLASTFASLKQAQANYDRVIPLAQIDAMSQSDVDAALAQLISAKENVAVAQQELINANLELSYTRIYTPRAGIVASSNAVVGDYVGPGTSFSVLTTVSYIDSVSVLLSLPVRIYLKQIKEGNRTLSESYNNAHLLSDITMRLSDGTIYQYKGEYSYTKTFVDNNADVIKFYVTFPNPNYALKAGQFVRVTASLGNECCKKLIPQQCVRQILNAYLVWVVTPDNTVSERKITVGDTYQNYFIVTSGLETGERVLVDGILKVKNGEKINVK